jgi:hypothetical protein
VSLTDDRWPAEWTLLTEAAVQVMKDAGDLPLASLAEPLSDFEGFEPPFDRKDFEYTLADLEHCAVPSQTRGFSLFLAGVALQEDDLRKVEGDVRALDENSACRIEMS